MALRRRRFAAQSVRQVPDLLMQATPWHQGFVPVAPEPALATAWLEALGDEDPAALGRRQAWDASDPDAQRSATFRPATDECEWAAPLEALRKAVQEAADLPLKRQRKRDQGGSQFHQRPFVDLWRRASNQALKEMRCALEPKLGFKLTPSAWEQLAASLLDRLCTVAAPALWECFNRERGPGVMLLSYLTADDDDHQPIRGFYTRFIRRHQGDGLAALLGEFPVLGRLLGTVLALWREASSEMLLRLNTDRPAIALRDAWRIPVTAPLCSIRHGVSDPHRGGRAVAILGFGGAEVEALLVYKPKDVMVDAVYQDMLRDLNRHTNLPPLRTIQILARPGYGYMEYVTHRTCCDAMELERFYRNAGRLTAILYGLGCSDCHHENLIATGDQLVLIDTETLLEPEIRDQVKGAESGSEEEPAAVGGLQAAIAGSVLRSGLLPMWLFVGPHNTAEDVSALGAATPTESTQIQAGWQALNTDGMRHGNVEVASRLPTSSPVGIGQSNKLSEHLVGFLEGFRRQAEALVERRPAWLGDVGMLANFAGLPRRVVLRDTRVYFALQQQLLQPSALVSREAQGLVLERLARTYLMSKTRPRHWPAFAAELRQMQQLDIPLFEHPIDGTALPLMSGTEPIEGFMLTSGLEACRTRLRSLNADDIVFQCRLIEGVVRARLLSAHNALTDRRAEETASSGHASSRVVAARSSQVDASMRLALAERLASQLRNLAFLGDDGTPEWLGMELGADGDKFGFGAVGLSLYGGSAGIALLQAALATGLGEECCTSGILKPLAELGVSGDERALRRWWRDQPLGSNGAGGILLTLLELDRLGATPPQGWSGHRDLALRLARGLGESRLRVDVTLDLLGGVAGLVGPLLRLSDVEATALAIQAGDHLIEHQLGNGGWPQPKAEAGAGQLLPLTGFSHGAAGMAAALANLHQHTHEPRFLVSARRAVAYERTCYDARRGNWPYHPSRDSDPAFMVSWCHGAPGIALSRLCLCGTAVEDESMVGELEAALRTTVQTIPEADHLCCGAMGLVAILRLAGQRLKNAEWQRESERMETEVLSRSDRNGGHFRMFGTREGALILPGFMTGLSGIGLVLLNSNRTDACVGQLLTAGLWPSEP